MSCGAMPTENAAGTTVPPHSDHTQHGSQQFSDIGLEELRQQMRGFAAERNWEQFHTPRNLLLALVGEVGELSEIFQWRGEVPPGLPGFTSAERTHVGQELSDVLLYLVRLADVCGVDLGTAVRDKMAHNAAKYPAEHCRGSAAKYTAYAADSSSNVSGQQQVQQDELEQQQEQQQQGQQQQQQQAQGQQTHHSRQQQTQLAATDKQQQQQQQGESDPARQQQQQQRGSHADL